MLSGAARALSQLVKHSAALVQCGLPKNSALSSYPIPTHPSTGLQIFRRGAEKLRQYRIILSADTAREVRQMLSQKRRQYFVLQR